MIALENFFRIKELHFGIAIFRIIEIRVLIYNGYIRRNCLYVGGILIWLATLGGWSSFLRACSSSNNKGCKSINVSIPDRCAPPLILRVFIKCYSTTNDDGFCGKVVQTVPLNILIIPGNKYPLKNFGV